MGPYTQTMAKPQWRRGNFLKAPKFKDTWVDNTNRTYMFVKNTEGVRWALMDSSEWGDDDILAYVRRGKNKDDEENELPEEGDTITVSRENTTFKFSVVQVFRGVGRTRTVPMIIQAT